jgi:uncharacterized membrane protein
MPAPTRLAAASGRRSLAKALTYRVVVMTADFVAILLFTRQMKIALGFMVVSNIYAAVLYFLHERLWARIPWGLTARVPAPAHPRAGRDPG